MNYNDKLEKSDAEVKYFLKDLFSEYDELLFQLIKDTDNHSNQELIGISSDHLLLMLSEIQKQVEIDPRFNIGIDIATQEFGKPELLEYVNKLATPFLSKESYNKKFSTEEGFFEYERISPAIKLFIESLAKIFIGYGDQGIEKLKRDAGDIVNFLNKNGDTYFKNALNGETLQPPQALIDNSVGDIPNSLSTQLQQNLYETITPESLKNLFSSYGSGLKNIFSKLEATNSTFTWESSDNKAMLNHSNNLAIVLYRAINSGISIEVIKAALEKAGLTINDSLLNLIQATKDKVNAPMSSELINFVGIMTYNMMDVKAYD